MRRLEAAIAFVLIAVFPCAAADGLSDSERRAKFMEIRARFDAALDAGAQTVIEGAIPEERADVTMAIGAIYQLGLMSDPDPIKASSFFSAASELGSPEADCALGDLYAAGVESKSGRIGRDMAMAMEYWNRAATNGSVKAMLELGKIHAEGSPEVPRDTKKALAHFMSAASRGDEEALARIEPIMEQAREWESRRPGREANFPTRREEIVKPDLERAERVRSNHLDRISSRVYVELSRLVAEKVGNG